jgi:hypothetical protein
MVLLAAWGARADIQTIDDDPFPGGSCTASSCIDTLDVVGNPQYFDIQKVVVDLDPGNSMQVQIFTNYSNRSVDTTPDLETLSPWNYGSVGLNIGDLVFGFPGLAYAVPLYDHGPFVHGNLYRIDGTRVYARTAGDVLNLGSGYVYRPDEVVWIGHGEGLPAPSPLATGVETVGYVGAPNAAYRIDLTFASGSPGSSLPADFWDSLFANGGEMSLQFASATCANDLIKGSVMVPVPEPATVLMLGTILLLLAGLGVRRRT